MYKFDEHNDSETLSTEEILRLQSAYKSTLLEMAGQYDGNIHRAPKPRAEKPEAIHEPSAPTMLHRDKPIPPALWITAWLAKERKLVQLYQVDRKNLLAVTEKDKKRVLEAVRRIKELEYLIKTYYPSDINGRK